MPTIPSRALRMTTALCTVLIGATAQASSIPEVTPRIGLAPASHLVLRGQSTLHDYTSTATRLQLSVELSDGLATGAMPLARLAGPGAIKAVVLTIPVEAMKSEKDGLDKNMYKALKATANPNIVFRMQSASAASNGADGVFHVAGELEVAGQRQPIEMDIRASETPDGIVLEGSKALLMSQFGIKPPSMFLGTLKTNDRVVIEWRLVLTNAGF